MGSKLKIINRGYSISPVSPIVANLYMEYLEQKALSTAPTPLGSGAGMWMTPLLSTRRSTNKASFNT